MSKPNWEQIRNEWETTKITFKALAEKHGVKEGTLKSRRSREKWSRDATNQKDATQKDKKMQPKRGAPKGNQNAKGNRGNPNPEPKFAERNTNALKHGLFSRYIPKETLEIMGMLEKSDPADLIWDQIQIQYAAIIRSQQIMYVNDISDMSKEVKKDISSAEFDSKEYEIQFAWDKQASFLNAQSRAISELRTSIRQFVDMTNEDDERRLKLEQMQLTIDKTKAEIDKLDKGDNDKPIEIMIKRKGDGS